MCLNCQTVPYVLMIHLLGLPSELLGPRPTLASSVYLVSVVLWASALAAVTTFGIRGRQG